jgi:gas vesicle protein
MSDFNVSPAGRLALAFALGASTGAIAALLLAPQSGAKTRKQLSNLAAEGRDKVMAAPHAMKEALGEARTAIAETLHNVAHLG